VLSQVTHILDRRSSNRALTRLRALLRSNEFYLIPLALVIGVIAGAIVTLMSQITTMAHVLFYGIPIDVRLSATDYVSPVAAMIVPVSGGLLLGVMEWFRRRWKIAGAVDPVEANALRGGRLSLRDSLAVTGQTMISNGSGASVGLESGYAQIGSCVASLLGQVLNLRRNDLRVIVGCGAGGAIAAAFGAPITGAFYAFELIVGFYSVSSAAPVLASSLAGALTSEYLAGAPYQLDVPPVGSVGLEQYLAMMVLALIASGVGIGVMRIAPVYERIFKQPWFPVWLRPVVGGLCVGAMAIVTPQVLGAGHGAMLLNLHRNMAAGYVALVIVLKLSACLISLASGFRGGLFFCSLFIGSMLGKLFAAVSMMSGLHLAVDPLVAMLTGMACLAVAIVGGPLTMSFMVLELTRSVDVTAVVLAGSIVTSIFVRFMFGHNFSTWRLHLRGETIRSANDVGWLRNLTVERLMRTDVGKVPATTTIAACRREFVLGSRPAVVVVNNSDDYCGLVLLPELFSGELDSIADDIQVVELARYTDVSLLPEMNVKTAMKIFDDAEAEVLAVLESENSRKVIGFLNESFARRRYVEEIDQATRGVLGSLS
jgi:chloride channel protein, CIC family